VAGCGGSAPAVTPAPHPVPSLQRLDDTIDSLIAAPELDRGAWGIAVQSLATGDPVYTENAQKLMMPASALKIVTLAAAAERLGWEYSYETRLVADGRIADGVLNGDLVAVGTGDPTIDDWDGAATRLFGDWAEQLKARGVRSVAGRVVGDDNQFDDEGPGSGWAWDDLDRSYAAEAGALQFNQNTARLSVFAGPTPGRPAVLSLSPEYSGLILRNRVSTADPGAPSVLVTRRGSGSAMLDARGTIGGSSGPLVRNVSVPNPTLYFVARLRDVLIAHGIDIAEPAVDIDDIVNPPDAAYGAVLVTHRSIPLAALAVTMMKVSQNLFAETMLKTLAAAQRDTSEAGRAAVRNHLNAWGLTAESALIADGSGLSRYNLITAEALVRVLARVSADARLREPFLASLPIAGVDGTLAFRMKGTAAEGRVRAKTGTFSNARALAGYATSADGEPLAFAIIANNFGISADVVDRTTDAIVGALTAMRR
jgi:D-alanyl-D-alanine carboxypeptidase/D-alanyl-D-alanine-endopeptidase (penicillin-binding protein 4)